MESLIGLTFMLLVASGYCAYYYFVVYKKMASPEARAAAFAAAGYHPGEGVAVSFLGLLMRRDPRGSFLSAIIEHRRDVSTGTHVFLNVTTLGRLHITIGLGAAAQNVMFEAMGPRPSVRVLGRVWLQDTTGLGDMLMSQIETTYRFVDDGYPSPPGTARRVMRNLHGQEEPTCILEIQGPGRPPLQLETYDTAVYALQQWAAGGAGAQPGTPMQQPMQHPSYGPPQPMMQPPGGPHGHIPQPHGPQGFAPQGQGAPQPPGGSVAPPVPGYGNGYPR